MLRNLHLTALRAFEAATRTGSFRLAADDLGLTPSAVSHAIRGLEQDLGTVLFEREGRSIRLTPEGETLMRHVERGFGELHLGLSSVAARKPQLLKLHCAPSFAAQWLVPRLRKLLAECSGLELRLATGTDYTKFLADEFDADIVYGVPATDYYGTVKQQGLIVLPLGTEVVTPLCAPSLAPEIRSPRDLLKQTLIESDNKKVRWPAWFAANGLVAPLPNGPRFDRSFMSLSAAADEIGVALESTLLAEREIASGRFVRPLVGVSEDVVYTGHWLVYPRSKRFARSMVTFISWLTKQLGLDVKKHVPQQVIAKLQKLAAKKREDHYSRAEAGLNKAGGDAAEVTAADWQRYARSPLFTFKRAREIAALLETRNTLQAARDGEPKANRLGVLLSSASGRAAFIKVVRLARSMTVGTEIADLTVCGAVPPYNALLGGKLVAMLAASPEVVLEYKRRYQALPSIIASSMAGRAIVRPANLVFIGTTSLYGERPNQYDRTSYPCKAVGGPVDETVRYRYLTSLERRRTSGVGTFQFGRDTKAAIEKYTSSTTNGRRVNNVFGEGTSPKLRSLRDGLNALGISSDEMLQHGIEKVVYGAAMVSNTSRYLLRLDDMPQYLFSFDEAQASTEKIAQYWFERWASTRIGRSDTEEKLLAHTLVRPIRHGGRVVLPSDDEEQLSFRME